jgi:hypothetical protein
MSTTSFTRHAPVDQTDDSEAGLRKRIEAWFVEQGVPSFVDRYSPEDARALVVGVLLIVLAFEVTARPERHLPIARGVAAPGVILLCVLPAMPMLRVLLDAPGGPARVSRLMYIGVAPALVLEVLLLVRGGWMPPLNRQPWPNFGIIAMTLLASYSLARKRAWSQSDGRHPIVGSLLPLGLIAANLGFAIERVWHPVNALVSAPDSTPSSQSVAAFFVSLVILAFAFPWRRRAVTPPPTTGQSIAPRKATIALVVLFGFQTAILPLLPLNSGADMALVIVGVLVVLASRWISGTVAPWARPAACDATRTYVTSHLQPVRQATHDLGPPVRSGLRGHWPLVVVGALLLMAYPLVVWSDTNLMAATRAFAVNAVYLLLALTVVSFGVDRVIVWALRESVRGSLRSLAALVQGIPLLLVFVVFFSITRDMWEFAHTISYGHLLMVAGLLIALTMVFLLLRSALEVSENCSFRDWRELEIVATGSGQVKPDSDLREVVTLAQRKPSTAAQLVLKPNLRRRLNAATVMVVYQLLFLIPIGIGSVAIYLGLGHLTIGTNLLKDWQLNSSGEKPVKHPTFFDPLWVKVSLFLAAFSVLYLAVTVTMSKDQRDIFLAAPRQALRQRFAVRLAYERVYDESTWSAPSPAAASASAPGEARGRSHVATSCPSTRAAPGATTSKILAALDDGDALTAGDIAGTTGLSRGTVSKTLWRLVRDGAVIKAKRGYRLASPVGSQA